MLNHLPSGPEVRDNSRREREIGLPIEANPSFGTKQVWKACRPQISLLNQNVWIRGSASLRLEDVGQNYTFYLVYFNLFFSDFLFCLIMSDSARPSSAWTAVHFDWCVCKNILMSFGDNHTTRPWIFQVKMHELDGEKFWARIFFGEILA